MEHFHEFFLNFFLGDKLIFGDWQKFDLSHKNVNIKACGTNKVLIFVQLVETNNFSIFCVASHFKHDYSCIKVFKLFNFNQEIDLITNQNQNQLSN